MDHKILKYSSDYTYITPTFQGVRQNTNANTVMLVEKEEASEGVLVQNSQKYALWSPHYLPVTDQQRGI